MEQVMNQWNPERHAAAQRATAEASFATANQVFESFQKMVKLNLQAVKSGIAESEEIALNALSGKSPQEWVTLQGGVANLIPDRVQSYYGQLFAIASDAQLEFANVASEQFATQQSKLQSLIDDAAQHAPATSETAITAFKSAISATGNWYETTRKAVQQAIQVAESNAEAASSAVSKTTRRAVEQGTRSTSK
ncbi:MULTISPECIES: TIGR01841 family phasin [Paraburkholderia]|uniref:TIGR01841 family phasin n=1 Tax=Paraburkholderia TaxID=1822464 RepID=UPI0022570AEA|nr:MULTISPECIES: TIGR01841 family phasin [Paraburkholderia]MCX4159808.1 TIGR01841 family phasin [Paraburkholderia aspalathi]MDN7169205.1 TIGR01841 family phasin [Paraburkholderia sp. SECH2]MDQ6397693.1 TIGR01841 family phasin [Paraburkholderia aspalathi]